MSWTFLHMRGLVWKSAKKNQILAALPFVKKHKFSQTIHSSSSKAWEIVFQTINGLSDKWCSQIHSFARMPLSSTVKLSASDIDVVLAAAGARKVLLARWKPCRFRFNSRRVLLTARSARWVDVCISQSYTCTNQTNLRSRQQIWMNEWMNLYLPWTTC